MKITIKAKNKKNRHSGVRDTWIPMSWQYNGAGVHKDKSKIIPRKQKYKEKFF
jgi:hypothetical protein